jgi:hypothetical protein
MEEEFSDPSSRENRPIEPGLRPSGISPAGFNTSRKNRATLIFFLGLLSLFMCGPVGIAAWVLANSDLKKIGRGEMNSDQVGLIKIGRVLGGIGTVLFLITVALAVYFFHKGFTSFNDLYVTQPLSPEEFVFSGDWVGNLGTKIKIRPDGRADFKSKHSSVTGGRTVIKGDYLSIGFLGIYKTWHIDKKPRLEDGEWIMELDHEIFTRRADDYMVRLTCSFRREISRKPCSG